MANQMLAGKKEHKVARKESLAELYESMKEVVSFDDLFGYEQMIGDEC